MSIFSAPKTPERQVAPPPPARLPLKSDPKVRSARRKDKQAAALAEGRDSTILTRGLGLIGPAKSSAGKRLLGN